MFSLSTATAHSWQDLSQVPLTSPTRLIIAFNPKCFGKVYAFRGAVECLANFYKKTPLFVLAISIVCPVASSGKLDEWAATPKWERGVQNPSNESQGPSLPATIENSNQNISDRDTAEPGTDCGKQLTLPSSLGYGRSLDKFQPIDFLKALVRIFDIPQSYLFETLLLFSLEDHTLNSISVNDFVAWSAIHHGTSFDLSKKNNPFNIVSPITRNLVGLVSNDSFKYNSLSSIYLQFSDPQSFKGKSHIKIRALLDEYLLAKMDGLYPHLVMSSLLSTTRILCMNWEKYMGKDITYDLRQKYKASLGYNFLNRLGKANRNKICGAFKMVFNDHQDPLKKQSPEVEKILGRLLETLLISLRLSDPNYSEEGLINPRDLTLKPVRARRAIIHMIDEIISEDGIQQASKELNDSTLGISDSSDSNEQPLAPLEFSAEEPQPDSHYKLSKIQQAQTKISQSLASIAKIHLGPLNHQREKLQEHIQTLKQGEEFFSTKIEIKDLNEIIEQREAKLEQLFLGIKNLAPSIEWIEGSLTAAKNAQLEGDSHYQNCREIQNSIAATLELVNQQVTAHQSFNSEILTATSRLLLEEGR